MSSEGPESSVARWKERRHIALVVGVNSKAIPGQDALKYAVQDAADLAHVLQDCGYELFRSPLVGELATTEQMRKAALALAKAIADNDIVVFYFSGHGVFKVFSDSVEDVYLVTDDFDESDLDFDKHAHLSIRWLREMLYTHKRAADIFLILECCYAGNGGQMGVDPYLQNILRQLKFYYEDSTPPGEIPVHVLRTLLAATLPDTVASEHDGHGLMASILLRALRGECLDAFDANHKDCITYTSLLSYLEKHMPPEQRPRSYGTSGQMILAYYPGQVAQLQQKERRAEREQQLHAMIFDDAAFLQDRLSNFVGREKEVNEVREKIVHLQQTGGYLTITGPAGQGKSSVIAHLIDEAGQKEGLEHIAYHFIPLDPGPDYQFTILRKLMVRLILKYELPDFYLDGQTLAALRDFFPEVLKLIDDKGQREVIYIDGLDQLEEAGAGGDLKGKRDLSFLPSTVPTGIVFVLGTRPNDILAPLELKKPLVVYPLRNLSRADFDAILYHREVKLESHLADQFYQKLGENALFLDLAAKELAARGPITTAEVELLIQRLAANPDNLFGLALERLSRHERLWKRVMKPLLGILLVAREPLGRIHLKQILNLHQPDPIDNDQLTEGLTRLGGLIISDGQKRYTLFHPKLREYLDEKREDGDDQKRFGLETGIFDSEDIQDFHTLLKKWYEPGDRADIWQDTPDSREQGRREYVRYHYIAQLYHAHFWPHLFTVLDTGHYGQGKIHWDPSTQLFAKDVELGQLAASWEGYTYEEGIRRLPNLWRYTLLRCSLRSRADRYPEGAFRLLVLLRREQEAIGLAELLTNERRKVRALSEIALQLREQVSLQADWLGLLQRAEQVALGIQNSYQQACTLGELGQALAQVGEAERVAQIWQQAEQVVFRIEDSQQQAKALSMLGQALAQAGQWQQAEQIISRIEDSYEQAKALSMLGQALAQIGQWQQAEQIISRIDYGYEHTKALSALSRALAQAGQWQQAEQVVFRIEDSYEQAEALSMLGQALAQAGETRRAELLWQQTEQIISRIKDSYGKAEVLSALSRALAQAGQWQQAEQVVFRIEDSYEQAEALSMLGQALAQAGETRRAELLWQQTEQIISRIKDSYGKAEVLSALSRALAQAGQWQQAEQVVFRIEDSYEQAKALSMLSQALAQAGQWQQAEQVVFRIEDSYKQAEALSMLGQALAQTVETSSAALLRQQAEQIISRIEDSQEHVMALASVAKALAQAGRYNDLLHLIQRFWLLARTREEAFERFYLATHFIQKYPELGIAFFEGFTWVDAFLAGEKGNTNTTAI